MWLHDSVGTDVAFIEACAEWAGHVASGEAVPVLLEALALVEGSPFDGPDYEWAINAHPHREAEAVVADAAHLLAELVLQAGDTSIARFAVTKGLTVTGNVALYHDRIKVELQSGNPEAAACAYRELLTMLDELGVEPNEETTALARRVLPRVQP